MAPDNNVAIPPVEIAIQPPSNRKADSKRNEGHSSRRDVEYLGRLIDGDVNHLRIDWNDFNVAAVVNDLLLRRGLQVAEAISLLAEPLDGTHDVLLLIYKCLSHFHGPLQILVHPLQHAWVTGQRLHAGVPRLLVNQVRVAAAGDVPVSHHDLIGERGRRQELGNQRIGIKGNWPQQLVELLRIKRLIARTG